MNLFTRLSTLLSISALSLAACDGGATPPMEDPDAGPPPPTGIAVLGAGTHDPASLEVTTIVNADVGIYGPRDLAFRPGGDHELWIVNHTDSSVVIVTSAGQPGQETRRRRGAGYDHFMVNPASLAFGETTFATVHETDEATQPTTPADFMGPSLWPADPIAFNAGHASHLDMLHNSPNSVGVEWDSGNAFWVFDGFHDSITLYDFGGDHGPGGEDHSDGVITRYAEGEVSYVPNVSSHMALDHATGLLYIADTGNRRIGVMDVNAGTPGGSISPNYDGATMSRMDGVSISTLVDGTVAGLQQPSGLELSGGMVWVTDRATSFIYAFELEGTEADHLDFSSIIEPGSLGALAIDPEGRLYVTDVAGDRVIRIAAPTP